MATNKNFVVKNGLEVDGNTLHVDAVNNRVGVKTSTPGYELDVNGVIQSSTLRLSVSTGTSPLTVTSTTKVANLNVDQLDGLDSDSFLRSDANDTFSGNLSNSGDNHITFGPNTTWSRYLRIGGNGYVGNATTANIATTNGNLHIDAATGNATYLNFYAGTAGVAFGNGLNTNVAWMGPDGDLWKGSGDNLGSVYWHAGNDGAGSGLDADLLDGLSSVSFLRSDADNTSATGVIRTSATIIEAGKGSGSVALVTNDGQGNANLAFNHVSGTPDATGSSGRLVCDVDSPTARFAFYLKNSTVTNTPVGLTEVLSMSETGVSIPGTLNVTGTTTLGTTTLGAQTWAGHITWNNTQNIYISGESSFDVQGSGQWQLWDTTGSPGPWITATAGGNLFLNNNARGVVISSNTNSTDTFQIRHRTDTDIYMNFYCESGTAQIADTFTDTTTDKKYIYFSNPNDSNDPGFIMHETSNATSPDERNEGVLHLAPSDDNGYGDYISIHGINDPDCLKLHTDGTIETATGYTLNLNSGTGSVSINSNTAWHAGNDGAGSGLDADLLDGQQGSFYTNASNITTGTLPVAQLLSPVSGNWHRGVGLIGGDGVMEIGRYIDFHTSNVGTSDYDVRLSAEGIGDLRMNGSTMWTSGNDGAGSGLDADLLDGLNSATANTVSTIVARDASGNFSAGTITATLSGNASSANSATIVNGTSGQNTGKDDRIIEPNSITTNRLQFGFTSWANNNTTPYADYLHLRSYTDATGGNDNLVMFRKDAIGMRIWQQSWNSASAYTSFVDVWHTGNDGAGSGLDADLLDGLNATSANTGSTIVARDASGNFNAGIITANYLSVTAQNAAGGEGGEIVLAKSDIGSLSGNIIFDINGNNLRIFENGGAFRGVLLNITGCGSQSTLWHANNDGAGSTLDADLLDGFDSSAIVLTRSTTVSTNATDFNTITTPGTYTVSGNNTWTGSTNGPTSAYPYGQLVVTTNGTIVTQNYYTHDTTGHWVRSKFNASDWRTWQEYWTNLNDGAGSGLDADLLDGKNTGTSGNTIPLLDGANTWSGSQLFTGNIGNSPSGATNGVWVGQSGSGDGQIQLVGSTPHIDFANATEDFDMRIIRSGDDVLQVQGGALYLENDLRLTGSSPTIALIDTDHATASLHVNSNTFYILRNAANTASWAQVDGTWPFEISLTNNDAFFGRTVYSNSYQNVVHFQGVWRNDGVTALANSFNYFLVGQNDAGNGAVHFINSSTRTVDGGANTYTIRNDIGPLRLGSGSFTTTLEGSTVSLSTRLVFNTSAAERQIAFNNGTTDVYIYGQTSASGGNIGMFDGTNTRHIWNYSPSGNRFQIERNTRFTGLVGLDAGQSLFFGREESFGGSDTGGNDYGYITWDNDNNTYNTGGSGDSAENGCLRIGTENDGFTVANDNLALEPTNDLWLYPRGGRVHFHKKNSTGGGQNTFTGLDAPSGGNGRGQFVLSSSYSDLVIASSQGNNDHGSTLTFATYNPTVSTEYKKFVINQGNWGTRSGYLDFGYSDTLGRTNPHSNINATDCVMTLDGYNKRVGIGPSRRSPGSTLDVAGEARFIADNAIVATGTAASDDVWGGCIEIREINQVGNSIANNPSSYAPGITFHWGNVAASAIKMYNDGSIRFISQNSAGSSYRPIHATEYISNLTNSSQSYAGQHNVNAPFYNTFSQTGSQYQAIVKGRCTGSTTTEIISFGNLHYSDGSQQITFHKIRSDGTNSQAFNLTGTGGIIWNGSNDGAGSSLDADLLDGYHVGTSGNTIPILSANNVWSGNNTFSAAFSAPQNNNATGGGIDFNGAGSTFIRGRNQDGASSTLSNLQLQSWFGIGFGPSITGQTVPQGENAFWINTRDGGWGSRGTGNVGGSLTVSGEITLGTELNFIGTPGNKYIDFYTKNSGGSNFAAHMRLVNHDSTSFHNAIIMYRDSVVQLLFNNLPRFETVSEGIRVFQNSGYWTGFIHQNTYTSATLEGGSFVDFRNELGITKAHIHAIYQTNGGSELRFAVTANSVARGTDTRTSMLTLNSGGVAIFNQNKVGLGVAPGGAFSARAAALALGDNDTGIAQNGDGQLELWANNQEVVNITNTQVDIYEPTVITIAGNQLLLHTGTSVPTVIHRNDGSDYYFLLSDAGTTASGTWNTLRPLQINLTSGRLLSSNGQTFAGGTTINSISNLISGDTPAINNSSYSTGQNHIELRTSNASNPILGFHRSGHTATALYHAGYGINSLRMRNADGNDGPIFSTFNDGAGSNLDSDLWDGQHRPNNFGNTLGQSAYITDANLDTNYDVVGASVFYPAGGASVVGDPTDNHTGNGYLFTIGLGDNAGRGSQLLTSSGGNQEFYFRTKVDVGWQAWRRVWHAGNHGAGSGLDADLLDGLNATTANTGSTIVARDASGNFSANAITMNNATIGTLEFTNSGGTIARPNGDITIRAGGSQIERGGVRLFNGGGTEIDGGTLSGSGITLKGGNGDVNVTQGTLRVTTSIVSSNGIYPATDNTGVVGSAASTWSNGQFTSLTIDSTLNVRGAIDLEDSDILRFGTSDDWELFHDGVHNYMDLNVGNLIVRDNTTTRFTFQRTTGRFESGQLTWNHNGSITPPSSGGAVAWNGNSGSGSTDFYNHRSSTGPAGSFTFWESQSGSNVGLARIYASGALFIRSTISQNQNVADFAEMFEWEDGNPTNEDRRGKTVIFDEVTGKIRLATDGDIPFGAVSPHPSIVGNGFEEEWSGKYLRNIWGDYETQNFTIYKYEIPELNQQGEPILDDDNNIVYIKQEVYSHLIDNSDSFEFPEDAINTEISTADENGILHEAWVINPNYDPTLEYIPRSKRKEWAAIGILGQLLIFKDQPTAPNWIKIKSLNEYIDIWLVR
jgi:hypothetical protein